MATPAPVAPPPTTIMSHAPGCAPRRRYISDLVMNSAYDVAQALVPAVSRLVSIPVGARRQASAGVPTRQAGVPVPTLLDQVASAHRGAIGVAGLLHRILPRAQLRTSILGRLLPRLLGDQPLADADVFGCVDHVLVSGRQNALDLLLGLADARGIHRVGGKDARDRPGLFPLERLQLLENADGAIGIVAGGVQVLHAQVIGLRLLLAREP